MTTTTAHEGISEKIQVIEGPPPTNITVNGVRFDTVVRLAVQGLADVDAATRPTGNEARIAARLRALLLEMHRKGYRGRDARRAGFDLMMREAQRCVVAQTAERGPVKPEVAGSTPADTASSEQGY